MDKFRVRETFNSFSVLHVASGLERGMGDGVDFNFGTEDKPLTVGMEGFREAWEADLNADSETLEAYFPEVLKAEKMRDEIEREFIALIRKAEENNIMVEAVIYKGNNPVSAIYLNSENLEGKEVVLPGKEPEPDIVFNVDWERIEIR